MDIRIGGYWYPRGGIPIDVFWQTGEPPKSLWLLDEGVPPYRARLGQAAIGRHSGAAKRSPEPMPASNGPCRRVAVVSGIGCAAPE